MHPSSSLLPPLPVAVKRSDGFTLLEVLVAFTIAALALAVLFKGVGSGLSSVRTAGRYEEAVSRAKSHLAALGQSVTLAPGVLEGDDGGGYHWRVNVQPLSTSRASDSAPTAVTLFAVEVDISWRELTRTRQFALRTERVGPALRGGN